MFDIDFDGYNKVLKGFAASILIITFLAGTMYGTPFLGDTNIDGEGITTGEINANSITAVQIDEFQTIGIQWNNTADEWQQITRDGDIITGLTLDDFNDIEPWSEITRVKINATTNEIMAYYGDSNYDSAGGEVMVQYPRFYYKFEHREINGDDVYRFWIADEQLSGYTVHPAFNQRVNGTARNLYLGAYEASAYSEDGGTTWKLASRAGVTPAHGNGDYTGLNGNTLSNLDIVEARQYGNNIGENWGIMNIWSYSAVKMLFAVEYGNLDSQTELGRGIVDLASGTGFAGKQTASDNINSNLNEALTGTGDQADGETPVTYRGLENPWGNLRLFIDGYEAVDSEYRILDPSGDWSTEGADGWTSSDYETSNTVPLTDSDGYISDIETESLLLPLMIPSATDGSSSTNIPEYFFSHDNGENNILFVGGSWYNGDQPGVSYLLSHIVAGYSARYFGARAEFLK